jgi:hypothetical protein
MSATPPALDKHLNVNRLFFAPPSKCDTQPHSLNQSFLPVVARQLSLPFHCLMKNEIVRQKFGFEAF